MGGFEKVSLTYLIFKVVTFPIVAIFKMLDWLAAGPFQAVAEILKSSKEPGGLFAPLDTPFDPSKPRNFSNVDWSCLTPHKKVEDEAPVPSGRAALTVDDDELWKE